MYPLNKGLTSKQAHVALPEGTFEEEHGRDGFYGPVSHLYHRHAPTGWTRIEGPLKPQSFDCNQLLPPTLPSPAKGGGDNKLTKKENQSVTLDAISSRIPLLFNNDVVLGFSRPKVAMPFYFRNADGDDLYFVHRGTGIVETDYGPLNYTQGDYIVIPRGTTYRVLPDGADSEFLVIESFSALRQPKRGLLGQHALYDPAIIVTPEPQPIEDDREWEVRVKRVNEMTSIFYPFNPIDVVGWKGDLTPWKLNIKDFCPVTSHRAHLAPSVHTTFLGDNFVVCSFVPRPLESDTDAVRVPFYHRNIDYDEVLFYHDGDFFSRDGIDSGMITFHPQGVHHGPHPKATAASWKKSHTDEYAVMLDTRRPLQVTPQARTVENPKYVDSWKN